MAGGQQINSAHGVMVVSSGDSSVATTGSASTSAGGTTASAMILPLRSLKTGSGSAELSLTGQASNVGIGTLTFRPGIVLLGMAITGAQGTVTYQGLALLSWNANSESDLAFYTVFHGLTPNPVNRDFEIDVGLATSYQMPGLAPGMTHYFSVMATDATGHESTGNPVVSKAY